MPTTSPKSPPHASKTLRQWSVEPRHLPRPAVEPPNVAETPTLLGLVAVAGPPVVALAGINVLLAMVLAGPFLLIATLAVAVTVLAAVTGAVLAMPYLLVRHLHRIGAQHA